MDEKRILVYIPVKNEEMTIKKVIDEISTAHPSWDILVVDDCSDDNSIFEVKKTKATIAPLIINTKGVGTILTAFMIAKKNNYDFMVKIDGDGQQEVGVLEPLIKSMYEKNTDIVIGSRYVKKQKETDSFLKVLGRVVSSSLINFKIRGKNNITDCTSGVRAWNSKSIGLLTDVYMQEPIAHDSMFWIREAIIASRLGLKINEIPAFYNKRMYGKSKSFSPINMLTFPLRLISLLVY